MNAPVRIHQTENRLVKSDDAVEEQQCLFILRSIEPGHLVATFVDRALLPKFLIAKPLASEILCQSDSPGITEHPANIDSLAQSPDMARAA